MKYIYVEIKFDERWIDVGPLELEQAKKVEKICHANGFIARIKEVTHIISYIV